MDNPNLSRAHFRSSTIAAAAGALLLAACGSAVDSDAEATPTDVDIPAAAFEADTPPLAGDTAPGPMDCNADLVEPFIGRAADFGVRAQVLEKVAPTINVRWLRPDEEDVDTIEMERLTIELDGDNTIIAATCD